MTTRKTKCEMLAQQIQNRALSDFGVVLKNIRLYPAQGAWRTNYRLDVMRWEGFADWNGDGFSNPLTVSLGSWDTMTKLLTNGFVITRNRPTNFELGAHESVPNV